MSVIVKGMEMPTSCTMCWLNTFCGVWNEEPVKNKGFNERLEDCPLTVLTRCKDCEHLKVSGELEHSNEDTTFYYICDCWHRATDEWRYCDEGARRKGDDDD